MSYSVDLRTRVINWVLGGNRRSSASEVFKVHYQPVKAWVRRFKETGECLPKVRGPATCRKLDLEALRQDVQDLPDSFPSECACRFAVVPSTISKAVVKWDVTRKKKTTHYLEQDEEQKRVFLEARPSVREESLTYLDECGIPQNLYRESGWAPTGEKVFGSRTGNRERKFNLIAAYGEHELKAPFLYEGVMNTALFNTYLTGHLLPVRKPGQTLVMDNATFHKSAEPRRLLESHGCQLWFLPPYSPELNPIEHL